jgi:hypothetical protein
MVFALHPSERGRRSTAADRLREVAMFYVLMWLLGIPLGLIVLLWILGIGR